MNVAPSAVSSAGAPGAGVIPGAPAATAAAAGAGSSFADVLRQLSGQDGDSASGDGAVAGEGGGRAFGMGKSGRKHEAGDSSSESDTGAGVTAATDDYTMALGAMSVPVALTVTPPPAPLAEVPAVTGDVANDDGPGVVTGAATTGAALITTAVTRAAAAQTRAAGANTAATVPSAGASAPVAGDIASAADAAAPLFAVPAVVPGDGGDGPSLVTTPSGDVADVGAPGSRVPGELPAAAPGRGLASGRADTAGQGRAVGRPEAGPAPFAAAAPATPGSTAPLDPAAAPAPSGTTTVTVPVTTGVADAAPLPTAAAPADPATAATPTAAAASAVARAMNEPAPESPRADGAPRGTDTVVPALPADTTPTAGAATSPAASDDTAATSRVAAAVVRNQHPGLAAALRAFQQAGAPAASTDSAPVSPTPTAAEAQSAAAAVAASRFSALAGAASDAVAAAGASEADRRPLVMPPFVVPASGGDLRVGGDLPASARLEVPGLPMLTTADGDEVRTQIVQSLRVQWAGGSGEARVRLRPEYLGEVVATVKVEQGTVTATLQADRPDVRRWMEANTQTLRDGLVEHGLKLDRLVILSEPARNDNADDRQGRARGRQPQPQPQPRPRRPRPEGETATFDLHT